MNILLIVGSERKESFNKKLANIAKEHLEENADCLWFFSPEYNHSYPAIIKNLIDWLSRKVDGRSTINGKSCAISGIGGRGKTEEGRKKLFELLSFVSASVIEQTEGFVANPEAFGNDNLIISAEDIERIKKQADIVLDRLR